MKEKNHKKDPQFLCDSCKDGSTNDENMDAANQPSNGSEPSDLQTDSEEEEIIESSGDEDGADFTG